MLSWNEKSGELSYNKVAQTFLRRTERVYNFEVSRDHTYFAGFAGVLVHNDSYLTNPSKFNIAKRYLRGISDEEIKETYNSKNAVKNFRLGQIYGEYFWKVEAYVVIEEFAKSGLPQNDESFFEFAFEHIRKQLKQNTGLTDPVEIEAFIAGTRDYYLIEMRGKPGLFGAVNAGIALGLGGNRHGGPRTKAPTKGGSKTGQSVNPGKKPKGMNNPATRRAKYIEVCSSASKRSKL